MNNLVSIITPSFNSSEFIESTINSVLVQTYPNWEMIIVDDNSKDNSIEIIEQFSQVNERIKLIKLESNKGAAVARNTGIESAKGQFIAFLDSDDLWHPEKLEKQLTFMGENINFSFTGYELIDSKGGSLHKSVDTTQMGSFSYSDMLRKKATLGCSTVMLRQSAFPDISMPLIRTGQDYGLWLKLLKSGNNAYLLNEVCSAYRILPNSISRNKVKKAIRQWQIYRELELLSFVKASTCFCFYAWRAVFRR